MTFMVTGDTASDSSSDLVAFDEGDDIGNFRATKNCYVYIGHMCTSHLQPPHLLFSASHLWT